MAKMFCSKCGAQDQTAESYCTRCGDWLPDIDALAKPGLFRKRTREEKIRKMRVLEVVSAGLALTSAAIILSVLYGNSDVQLLFLSFVCCLVIAMYQIVNFYLGRKLQQRIVQSRVEPAPASIERNIKALNSGEPTAFVNRSSIVENTTERLEAIPRRAKREK